MPGSVMKLRRAIFVFVLVNAIGGAAGVLTAKEPLPGSDWPMYRHDPALTAVSPLRGGLSEAPCVAWSIDLGGPHVPAESILVRDVIGNGRDQLGRVE